MSESLYAVWKEVETLIDKGFSLIPIRDKADEWGDEKSPYKSWAKYQSECITKDKLWHDMSEKNTTAIAIVCGKISNNLWVVDIDSKHKAGIDALVFKDIQNFYPELWAKLRIHQSKNKGYHIPVFLEGEVPRSERLAGRETTQTEKEKWADKKGKPIKQAPKQIYFLETRGEGGLISWPPSMGYSVTKDAPIPTITEAERLQLENICRSYTEIIQAEKEIKPSKQESEYYDTDPFVDYNNRVDIADLMASRGWNVSKQNSRYILFTKPGGKKKDVHAGYDRQKGLIRFFTTETDAETDKSMRPATLLALWDFNNDKKALYRHLVENGYGKVKPAIEKRLVKQAALSGRPIQKNFSEEAKSQLQQLSVQLQQQHPYGIFWETDEDGKIAISRERLYAVADGIGFRLHKESIVQIEGQFIYDRDKRYFFDTIKSYIQEEETDLYEDICNAYESFMQHNGKFTIERLPILDESSYAKDTRDSCQKFYNNGYLTIAADDIVFSTYDMLPLLVFHSRMQPRDYHPGKGGKYLDFLEKACELSQRRDHIKSIIGFLAHEYKDETTGFIIILTEQVQDPKAGGGSGKNVFCNLLRYTTSYISKSGAQAKYDEKFFQIWNGQKIFAISDAPENFNYLFLKEPATGDFVQKKLFINEYVVSVQDAPKFIIQTNYSYEVSDGGLRRRMHPLEFTNYFTKKGGIDIEYGGLFPMIWTKDDWAGFDNFIAECVQFWLHIGLKIVPAELTETGWQKQFEHTYGVVIANFIRANWDYWKKAQWITNEKFKQELESYYIENGIAKNFQPSMVKINKGIKEWAEKHNHVFTSDVLRRSGIAVEKGRTIEENAPF